MSPSSANHASAEMPFLDHLEELRWRIIWSLVALAVAFGLAFVILIKIDILLVLERPILPYLNGNKLVFTHPGDPFSITMSMAFTLGIIMALPVILYQVWAFISPALYKNEKRLVWPVLFFAICLFISGVALAWLIVLPLAIEWLMGFQTSALTPMITASDYFSFATSMALAFGVCFELPVVILVLASLGFVTPQLLNRFRRHAIVVCFIIGAFLTPGDLVATTIAMAVPLYGLYEVSVVLTYVIYRRRQRRLAALEASASSEAPA